ncbi:hypothetical protein EJ06DRAFT_431159 [Trichodelitschia bisporula]|uniref:Uncharacterized protein n=1 Tax=Trichodelitschia bisporula TaxID=703511 RepID=A0A6G1HXA7_9PEZI|nr:hypothetical protein EJ06DRAFT_431159 [Trichodelitschia bisporula]
MSLSPRGEIWRRPIRSFLKRPAVWTAVAICGWHLRLGQGYGYFVRSRGGESAFPCRSAFTPLLLPSWLIPSHVASAVDSSSRRREGSCSGKSTVPLSLLPYRMTLPSSCQCVSESSSQPLVAVPRNGHAPQSDATISGCTATVCLALRGKNNGQCFESKPNLRLLPGHCRRAFNSCSALLGMAGFGMKWEEHEETGKTMGWSFSAPASRHTSPSANITGA